MEFYMKLPRNKKEFALFLALISIISVNIIAPLITFFEAGFHFYIWTDTLKVIPLIFICVVALVLLTHKPADWLTSRFVKEGDSFSAHTLINTLCCVLFMSMFMTVIGTWIGTHHVSMKPFHSYFQKWPRNFGIALFVETCIAQPIARFVMLKIHQHQDSKKK